MSDQRPTEDPAATSRGDDAILPFQLDRANVRGRLVRLDGTLEAILRLHDYPAPVSALAAEAALLTAMIGQMLKLRWRLSLQVRGNGPISLIATDYFAPDAEGAPARLRVYASHDAAALDPEGDGFGQIGAGVFGITIDQGAGGAPYQGITPVAGGSLAACAETYFAQSEQIATTFAIAAALASAPGEAPRWRGGGLMIQHLPDASPGAASGDATGEAGLLSARDVAGTGESLEDWMRVETLLRTVEPHELIGPHVAPESLLLRLFHEETPRVFPVQKVAFGCTCSQEKVAAALADHPAETLAEMAVDGRIVADCQFCGAHYALDAASLG